MFSRKSEKEENREEVNLNQDAAAEENVTAGSTPDQPETPGTGQGEGTAGNTAEEILLRKRSRTKQPKKRWKR